MRSIKKQQLNVCIKNDWRGGLQWWRGGAKQEEEEDVEMVLWAETTLHRVDKFVDYENIEGVGGGGGGRVEKMKEERGHAEVI